MSDETDDDPRLTLYGHPLGVGWHRWQKFVRKFSLQMWFEPTADISVWRDYYDDGYTPKEAIREEMKLDAAVQRTVDKILNDPRPKEVHRMVPMASKAGRDL